MSILLCAVLASAVFTITKPQVSNEITLKAELSEKDITDRRAAPGLYQTGKMDFVTYGENNTPLTWTNLCTAIDGVTFITVSQTGSKETGDYIKKLNVNKTIPEGDLVCANISGLTSLNQTFYDCSKLTSIDLRNFDMSKVTDMSSMFAMCYNLLRIELPLSVDKMSTATTRLGSTQVEGADHYALTSDPATAITTITSDMAGKTIELYDVNNVSLAPNKPVTPDTPVPSTGVVANVSIIVGVLVLTILLVVFINIQNNKKKNRNGKIIINKD